MTWAQHIIVCTHISFHLGREPKKGFRYLFQCSLHDTWFSTLVYNVFFISIYHVKVNQEGGRWVPRHLPRCGASAEKQGNQLPLEELSSSQQIKRENKAEAEPAASTKLYSCQLRDYGQVISSCWHHKHFHLFHVRICKYMKAVKLNSFYTHLPFFGGGHVPKLLFLSRSTGMSDNRRIFSPLIVKIQAPNECMCRKLCVSPYTIYCINCCQMYKEAMLIFFFKKQDITQTWPAQAIYKLRITNVL